MSAEKDIVNYWYNKKGLFTINNIKTSNNRDCGILALKFDKARVNEVFHVEVSCSITNNISETSKLDKSIGKMVKDKFETKSILNTINKQVKQFSLQKQNIKKIIVIGAVPKSRKSEIRQKFQEKNVEVIEFENIMYDVLDQLDTQYYKNDIIRTLQLTKFLLLNQPSKMAKLLTGNASSSRKEFFSSVMENDEIMKDFKRTSSERLGILIKNSGIKPDELASMVENNILNKRTRKMFWNSLMEQEKSRKSCKTFTQTEKERDCFGKVFLISSQHLNNRVNSTYTIFFYPFFALLPGDVRTRYAK